MLKIILGDRIFLWTWLYLINSFYCHWHFSPVYLTLKLSTPKNTTETFPLHVFLEFSWKNCFRILPNKSSESDNSPLLYALHVNTTNPLIKTVCLQKIIMVCSQDASEALQVCHGCCNAPVVSEGHSCWSSYIFLKVCCHV